MTSRALTVNVLTLFPDMLTGALAHSILKRAAAAGRLAPRVIDIRDYCRDRHRTADDKPYGGGSGMILKVEPVDRALRDLKRHGGTGPVYLLSPAGRRLDQALAAALARKRRFTLICGHYEGVDERIAEHLCDGEISIGDYVLTGGEPAALVVIDAVARLVPGVLGAADSAALDSFADGLLDYPHYTRPAVYRDWPIPAELLSGNHAAIAAWRRRQQLARTRQRRPDLLAEAPLAAADKKILDDLASRRNSAGRVPNKRRRRR